MRQRARLRHGKADTLAITPAAAGIVTDLTLQIKAEIAKARKLRPGYTKSDLSGIINSYGDTLPDDEVLAALRKWNARNSK